MSKSEKLLGFIRSLVEFYDLEDVFEDYLKETEPGRHDDSDARERVHAGKILVSSQLKEGAYTATFRVEETLSSADRETWFEVVNPPLRSDFLGGSARNVSTNITFLTLFVEVRVPSSVKYKLIWSCRTLKDDKSCFQNKKNLWSEFHYETTRLFPNVLQMFLHRLKLINRELNHTQDHKWTFPNVDKWKSLFSNISFLHKGNPNWRKILLEDFPRIFELEEELENWVRESVFFRNEENTSSFSFWNAFVHLFSLLPVQVFYGDVDSFLETVRIPIVHLRPDADIFLFQVEAYNMAGMSSSEQVIVLSDYSDENVGILQPITSQIPFGATRRVVFESFCYSCSEYDLRSLEYEWQLGQIVENVAAENKETEEETQEATLQWKDDGNTEGGGLVNWSTTEIGRIQTEKPKTFKYPESDFFSWENFTHNQMQKISSDKSAEIAPTERELKNDFKIKSSLTENYVRYTVGDMSITYMTDRNFVDMTSTGVESPVLVLYTDSLNKNATYILTLKTRNSRKNITGKAFQLLQFSRQPTVKGCNIEKLGNATFGCGCEVVGGLFYPVKLMYFYHFQNSRQKTLFYFGSLPWIEFTLPSGPASNNFTVYVTLNAVDSQGCVSSSYENEGLVVEPRYKTTFGIYSLFIDISALSHENPAIELQRMRTLAWELNILPPNSIIQFIDSILGLIFYKDECEDPVNELSSAYSFESFGFRLTPRRYGNEDLNIPFKQRFLMFFEDWLGDSEKFVRSNLLKSCARDQVVIKASQIPSRDEVEVLMIITTLTVLVDAPENISWLTFQRVVKAMLNAKKHHMWFWDLQSEIRTEVAENYFLLTSAVLNKEYEIFDCSSVPYVMINTIIDSFFDLMAKEITSRFLEEQPLTYISEYMKFDGYLTNHKNINSVRGDLPFRFLSASFDMPGIHTVMALLHFRTPYSNSSVPINSNVLNLRVSWKFFTETRIMVFLPRSYLLTEDRLDFRMKVSLNPELFAVYEFQVRKVDLQKTLFISLELIQMYTPVDALLLVCKDLQSLDHPLQKQELPAGFQVITMVIESRSLQEGRYLIVIMDKSTYESQGLKISTTAVREGVGADFMLGAWWAQCFVWDATVWVGTSCYPLNSSTWRITHCMCSSCSTTYGAVTETILTEENQVTVNELMLFSSFVAFYFIVFLFLFYVVMFVFLYRREKDLTKRRNVWLSSNSPYHRYGYLLTIKTGFQSNAGTFSSVFVILNGTDAMSSTTRLQTKGSEALFTRGSVCSFILTSSVPLGDILSVQLWHEDYDQGKGWFVCEVSVLDLQNGSRFVYPCFKLLSVASNDAQVLREVTLEKPTTFRQDFEHFLPQYMGEHTHWNGLFAKSNLRKFFPLQSLTIFVTVWVLLCTASLLAVKRINSSHTMMTPDPHIETLYCGLVIAVILLPVQWILRMGFKASNIIEEKVFYNRLIKSMMTSQTKTKKTKKPKSRKDNSTIISSSSKLSLMDERDFFDENSEFWKQLSNFAKSFGPIGVDETLVSPSFAKLVRESNETEIRQRLNVLKDTECQLGAKVPDGPVFSQKSRSGVRCTSGRVEIADVNGIYAVNERVEIGGDSGDAAVGFDSEFDISASSKSEAGVNKEETMRFFVSAAMSMSIGWIFSLGCIGVCFAVLLKDGSGIPKDYSSLWIQTVFIAISASTFLIQPFVVTVFTLYKVCLYRIFGIKDFIRLWTPAYLDHAVTVWNYHKEQLFREEEERKEQDTEEQKMKKDLENVRHDRYLRFVHPPPEHVLVQHRNRFLMKKKISSLIRDIFIYFGFFFLFCYTISNYHLTERYYLNKALKNTASNCSFIDREKHFYKAFLNITTVSDWYEWAYTEFLDLTFNYDSNYSDFKVFCDSESVIIGTPRIRMYEVARTDCVAKDAGLNESVSDVYNVRGCYPDYEDDVTHVYGFMDMQNPDYALDAHYLSVIHGYFSDYSYTEEKKMLPDSRIKANIFLSSWQTTQTMKRFSRIRAVVTEFLLFHPQSSLYSSVQYLAEFPSISGAKLSVYVSSAIIYKEDSYWIYAFKHGELVLVAVAMYLLKEICIELYKNRLIFWKTYLSFINLATVILCWSYVICLMLRVHLAEDILREIEITSYTQFVNIKSLTAWDRTLEGVFGLLMMVYLLRFFKLLSVIPLFRKHGEVLLIGIKESLKMSFGVFFLIFVFAYFGHLLFGSYIEEFFSNINSITILLKTLVFPYSFYYLFFKDSTSYQIVYAKLFFLMVFVCLFFMVFGIYKAIFIYAKKHYTYVPDSLEICFNDVIYYFKNYVQAFKVKMSRILSLNEKLESKPRTEIAENSFNLYLTEMESLVENLRMKVDSILKVVDSENDVNFRFYETRNSSFGSSLASAADNNSETSDPEALNDEILDDKITSKIDLRPLDDVLSCPSELNHTAAYLLSEVLRKEDFDNEPIIDNREQISKFLDDVASNTVNQLQVMSHGKYGKTDVLKRKSKSFISLFNENLNVSLSKTQDYQHVNQGDEEDLEEKFYFSPVPIQIEGIDELLAKYGANREDDGTHQ